MQKKCKFKKGLSLSSLPLPKYAPMVNTLCSKAQNASVTILPITAALAKPSSYAVDTWCADIWPLNGTGVP